MDMGPDLDEIPENEVAQNDFEEEIEEILAEINSEASEDSCVTSCVPLDDVYAQLSSEEG